MTGKLTRLKYIAKLSYGEALSAENSLTGEYAVYGSNGPYASIDTTNTNAPAIIIGRKGSHGKINWSSVPCFASDTTFFIDNRTTTNHLRWLYYALQTLNLDEESVEAAVPGLNRENAYSKRLTLFELSKQKKIADFLDIETKKIDDLIKAKEKLLGALSEKRQALITQAVTRGLNPKAKMKDSGIDWLGEIPEHWGVVQLKFLSKEKLMYGANEAGLEDNPDFPRFIRITDILEGELRDETFKSLSPELARPFLLTDKDILLARSGATVGKAFIYRESSGPACFAGYLIRLRCNQSMLLPEYFILVTQSQYYWSQISIDTIQATIQNYSGEKYASMKVILPNINEQNDIVRFIENELKQMDLLRMKTEVSISLLKERKSALITEAITGQLNISQ